MRPEDQEYIEKGTINVTAPCFAIRSVNCTVSYPEAVQARRETLEKVEKQIAENLEYQRVKKGKRELTHTCQSRKITTHRLSDPRPRRPERSTDHGE